MAYPGNSSPPAPSAPQLSPGCKEREEHFTLYAHQIWNGPDAGDVISVLNHPVQSFGAIRSDDWPLLAGPDPGAKVVGRVEGQHSQARADFNLFFIISFKEDSFKGSSLVVAGLGDPNNEWAILGGTGQFTLAQGVVYQKVLSPDADNNGVMQKLDFDIFYRPIQKPTNA